MCYEKTIKFQINQARIEIDAITHNELCETGKFADMEITDLKETNEKLKKGISYVLEHWDDRAGWGIRDMLKDLDSETFLMVNNSCNHV